MTDSKQIAELRGLLTKAIDPPWHVEPTLAGNNRLMIRSRSIGVAQASGGLTRDANAALIVAAINALSSLLDTAEKVSKLEEALADPVAVHVNMLRGGIAKPTPTNIWHLYGAEALIAAMPNEARALLTEPTDGGER